MPTQRKIIHIDMDAFFAAVEQRDFPHYRNKPLVIGGSPHSRGVVSTVAMKRDNTAFILPCPPHTPIAYAHKPFLLHRDFPAYQEASAHIRKIFYQYTSLVEPLSLDEAYLDVSDSLFCKGSATLIAREIKAKIKQQTQLTASAGVSYNEFLAKIASDMDKPDGLYLITPEQGIDFSANLPVNKFHGIGKATFKKMQDLGIHTGEDLKACSLVFLQQHFGKAGLHYYHISRGIDLRPVTNNRTAQSIGTEITFPQNILDFKAIFSQLQQLLTQALAKLKAKNLSARTLSIKIKYYNFVQITRSHTVANNLLTTSTADLSALLITLLKTTEVGQCKVRLVGIHLSTLQAPSSRINYQQLDLFNVPV